MLSRAADRESGGESKMEMGGRQTGGGRMGVSIVGAAQQLPKSGCTCYSANAAVLES